MPVLGMRKSGDEPAQVVERLGAKELEGHLGGISGAVDDRGGDRCEAEFGGPFLLGEDRIALGPVVEGAGEGVRIVVAPNIEVHAHRGNYTRAARTPVAMMRVDCFAGDATFRAREWSDRM